MELLFIGLAAGAIAAYFVYSFFNSSKRKEKEEKQSVVLMEKIRAVCKFITVEGDFSEIFHLETFWYGEFKYETHFCLKCFLVPRQRRDWT